MNHPTQDMQQAQTGSLLERFFQLKAHRTDVRKEVIGGLTTFLTMAYIIFVNPSILGDAGMDKGALFTVTCVASFIGTLITALWPRVPFAMAPGMGLNAFFTYTLVLGQGVAWETALGIVFLSGVTFVVLTFAGVREKLLAAIPQSLRMGTAAGIGLFIGFIGMKNMGLIVADPATLLRLGDFNLPVVLGLLAFLLTVILEIKRVTGGILIGILAATAAGIGFGIVEMPTSVISLPPSMSPLLFKLDISSALSLAFIAPIFSFMFVDLFDSLGTIVACSYQANLVDKDGRIPRIGRILEADAFATLIGALLGTSTTTTYIESASGISQGARTGLASLVTALLFVLALLFSPLAAVVPAFATAPALMMVGVYMFQNVRHIDFDDFVECVPAFLTVILMPLTYSISTGLTFGFISYVLLAVISGKRERISPAMWVIGAMSMANLLVSVM